MGGTQSTTVAATTEGQEIFYVMGEHETVYTPVGAEQYAALLQMMTNLWRDWVGYGWLNRASYGTTKQTPSKREFKLLVNPELNYAQKKKDGQVEHIIVAVVPPYKTPTFAVVNVTSNPNADRRVRFFVRGEKGTPPQPVADPKELANAIVDEYVKAKKSDTFKSREGRLFSQWLERSRRKDVATKGVTRRGP